MSDFQDLVSDIQMNAGLSSQEATGFYMIHCPVCKKNDRKTGGFKFEHDHIIYNCFRGKCDATCVMTEGEPVSRKFKTLMKTIGVDIPASLLVKKQSLADKIQSLDHDLYVENSYKPVVFSDGKLVDALPSYWIKRLENRCVDLETTGIKYIKDDKFDGDIAFPFYVGNMCIGHQIYTRSGKYIKKFGGQEHPIYIPNKWLSDDIVLVVEGTFDAECFPNTCAVMGDHISPQQAYHLRGRNVVMLPDRTGGNKFHEQFYKYDWGLCVPPWKEKDLNSAVMEYGHMAVAQMIVDHIYWKKVHGQTAYNMWRK